MEIKVYELKLKVYLLENVPYQAIQMVVSSYMDRCLGKKQEFLKLHTDKTYKYYCFSNPFPLERDGIYKKGNIYTVTIRTVIRELYEYYVHALPNSYTNILKGLTCEARTLPQKSLEKVYNISSAVLKNDTGYWRSQLSPDEFEKRLKDNLVKKYEDFTGNKADRDLPLYNRLEFMNKKPVAMNFKDIVLLGDKLTLYVEPNKQAQDIFQLAIGVGIMENNSRGSGFCNYRWI